MVRRRAEQLRRCVPPQAVPRGELSFSDGNRFGGQGLYLLDEPEAALSPARQLELLALVHQLERKGSQFLIATHSPILMAYPGAEVLELREEGICSVDYRQTEHYLLTRRFLEAPDRMLRYLLEEE